MLTAPSQCTNDILRQRTKEDYTGIRNSFNYEAWISYDGCGAWAEVVSWL